MLAEVIEYDAYYYDNETHNPSLEVDDEVDSIDPAELEYPEDGEDIDESEEVSTDTDDDDGITIN